jgi:hypothetical protein
MKRTQIQLFGIKNTMKKEKTEVFVVIDQIEDKVSVSVLKTRNAAYKYACVLFLGNKDYFYGNGEKLIEAENLYIAGDYEQSLDKWVELAKLEEFPLVVTIDKTIALEEEDVDVEKIFEDSDPTSTEDPIKDDDDVVFWN